MKVLNFGSCNIDYFYALPHFVSAGETLSATAMTRLLGGKGFNQSLAIARSGVPVYHAGCIGEDGEDFKTVLKENGANTDYLKTVDTPSGHAIIQVTEKGENCIIISGGANAAVTKDYIDEVLADFEAGDIIVLQNEISNLEYIIDTAYKKGMRIVLNPSPFNEIFKKIDLNKLFVLILNEVEAEEFSGADTLKGIMDYFTQKCSALKVMLTLGKRGCIFFDTSTGEYTLSPTYKVKVADTTAAGDTFTGYFVRGILENKPMDEVLKAASVASSLAVSKKGSSNSIPKVDEVLKAMEILEPEYRDEKIL